MGGGCTKLVSVQTPHQTVSDISTIIVPFNNKVHSKPKTEEQNLEVQPQTPKPNKKVRSKLLTDIEEKDSLSNGDHIRDKDDEEKKPAACELVPDGDFKSEEKPNARQNDGGVVNEKTFALRELCANETDVVDKLSRSNSSRSASPVVQSQTDKTSNEQNSEHISEDMDSTEGLKDSNANSRHILDVKVDYQTKQKEGTVEVESGSKCAGDSQKNDQKQDENKDKRDASLEKGDPASNGSQEEVAACEVQTLVQDSLFFFPLETDNPRPVTPHKIPERLQNRPRKPPLSYNERMLLADLNRFEQLDKRREFAVKRNRSVARNGKLPKINGQREDPCESGTNTPINNED